MPRDASGNYTLPAGNPVIPNTIIATNWANTTMDDIAAALTASLSVDGSVTTAKLANLSVTTAKLANNSVTRAKLDGSLQAAIAGKNYIINGGFSVWQAATSLGSGTGLRYTADMTAHNSAGSTYSVSQNTFANGQQDVPGNAEFFIKIATTSVAGAGNFCIFYLPIEDANTLNGRTVTFSMYIRATASINVALEMQQNFGTGGAPSATVSAPMGLMPVTTTFTRRSMTVTLPSTTGKTFGTDNNDFLGIIIWLDAGSNFNTRASNLGQQTSTVDIYGLKLEEGTAVNQYDVPVTTDEFMRCYRYYVSTTASAGIGPILFSGNVTNANPYSARFEFPAPMRAVPAMTFVDGGGSASFPAAGTISQTTREGARCVKTANATGTGFFSGTYIADARLI